MPPPSRAYDVEVEPDRPRTPGSAPRFGGGPPPPPPPPPPPTNRFQPPSRRELLFGALGVALGAAGATTYNNRPLDPEEVDERLTELLDELMDNETLLNLLGEEIILSKQMEEQRDAVTLMEGLKEIDDQLSSITGGR